jgi:hypothetical protein
LKRLLKVARAVKEDFPKADWIGFRKLLCTVLKNLEKLSTSVAVKNLFLKLLVALSIAHDCTYSFQ